MYRKSAKGWTKHADFMLLDLMVLQAAFVLAYTIRHDLVEPYATSLYRNMALFLCIADILVLILFETLKNVLKRGYYQELAVTVKHVILVSLFASLYLFTGQEGQEYSRVVFYFTAVLYCVMTYVVRLLWKQVIKSRMKNANRRSLLILTTGDKAVEVIQHVRRNNYLGYMITGVALIDRDMIGEIVVDVPVVAGIDTVASYVCQEWVDEVLIRLPHEESIPENLLNEISATGVAVHIALVKRDGRLHSRRRVEQVGGYTVLTSSISYATTMQLFLKRTMDIVGGLVGCVLTGIIFLFVAPAIYIQSPGPIFFSQIRVGKNGKRFRMYKFRSMYPDAEERKKELMQQNKVADGLMFKMDFDPRVIGNKILPDGRQKTGIGQFIRATSLDEFPQFYNVLKGDMSLVGTRPPTEDEWERYDLHHRARMAIKPGITGLWQISGRSNITDFEEVVKLDTQYITDWSMGMDFRILLKTVKAVLGKDGSV